MMNKKAQSVSEYAIIVGLIGSALLMMSLYFQRGIQRVIKEPFDNLGGFGSGIFSAQRIQEIGIEDNVDQDGLGPEVASESESTFNKIHIITTSEGGRRELNIDSDSTNVQRRINRSFQRIEYDQVTR